MMAGNSPTKKSHEKRTSGNQQVQSNLGKDGIASRFYSPGGSSNLQLHDFAGEGGFKPEISTSSGGQGSHLTQYVTGPTSVAAKWRLNLLNSLSRVHECDRRQTDHATEKYIAIGRIVPPYIHSDGLAYRCGRPEGPGSRRGCWCNSRVGSGRLREQPSLAT